MGLFDSIKNALTGNLSYDARRAVDKAVDSAADALKDTAIKIGKGINSSKSFKFEKLPTTLEELQALPEAKLDTAFKTAALTIVALTRYEADPETTYAMLDFLKGPESPSALEKQQLHENLDKEFYKIASFFEGAKPENNYTPSTPYKITIYENPYSFDEENWATLYVKSGGSDSQRPIKLRKKPSTGQWFLNDIQCLQDVRKPASEDPWA